MQINGKVRTRINVPPGFDKVQLEAAALDDDKVQQLIQGKTIVKVIAVPDKLNIVVMRTGRRDESRRARMSAPTNFQV